MESMTIEDVRDTILKVLEKNTSKAGKEIPARAGVDQHSRRRSTAGKIIPRSRGDGSALKKEIDRRKNEIRDNIGNFDRISYFDIFNSILRERFYKLVDGTATSADFNVLRAAGFGTKQWSDDSFNFMDVSTTCSNTCLYCYISGIYNRYGRLQLKKVVDYLEMVGIEIVSDEHGFTGQDRRDRRPTFRAGSSKMDATWGKNGKKKLFMSPTSHDIFPENVDGAIAVWKRMLDAGHYLIIVSKPLLACMEKITDELSGYKDRVLFRFTITSNRQEILNRWELFAPTFDERVSCLKLVKECGFKVSVSMEPFLSDPIKTVEAIREHVTGEIWIGMMNGYPSEKVLGKPFSGKLKAEIDRAKELYTFENVERIVAALRGDPAIQWKESFIKAYVGHRKAAPKTLLDK